MAIATAISVDVRVRYASTAFADVGIERNSGGRGAPFGDSPTVPVAVVEPSPSSSGGTVQVGALPVRVVGVGSSAPSRCPGSTAPGQAWESWVPTTRLSSSWGVPGVKPTATRAGMPRAGHDGHGCCNARSTPAGSAGSSPGPRTRCRARSRACTGSRPGAEEGLERRCAVEGRRSVSRDIVRQLPGLGRQVIGEFGHGLEPPPPAARAPSGDQLRRARRRYDSPRRWAPPASRSPPTTSRLPMS